MLNDLFSAMPQGEGMRRNAPSDTLRTPAAMFGQGSETPRGYVPGKLMIRSDVQREFAAQMEKEAEYTNSLAQIDAETQRLQQWSGLSPEQRQQIARYEATMRYASPELRVRLEI